MKRARLTRTAAAALVVGALAAFTSSCISERGNTTQVDPTGCNVQLPSEAFGSTIVIIRDFAFTPAQVTVSPGGKVTWVNCGPVGTDLHTSTSDASVWSSELLAPGETFTQTFPTAGAFPYHCAPHPGMLGTVTVN
jgi:plastocyanin